jgi:CHASE3 domain sensor protein
MSDAHRHAPRYRFSLRTLFVAVTIVILLAAAVGALMERNRQTIREVQQARKASERAVQAAKAALQP